VVARYGHCAPHRDDHVALSASLPYGGAPLFVAFDVETANSARQSVCQIGVACGYAPGEVTTWSTLVRRPQVTARRIGLDDCRLVTAVEAIGCDGAARHHDAAWDTEARLGFTLAYAYGYAYVVPWER
jgi:hypothetical protein